MDAQGSAMSALNPESGVVTREMSYLACFETPPSAVAPGDGCAHEMAEMGK